MPAYYTCSHRETCYSISTVVLHAVISEWTLIIAMWIYFYICTNEWNVHRSHTCTIPKVHACKSYDASGCHYVCILVAEDVLNPEKNRNNSIINHQPNLQWNWIFFAAVQLSVNQQCSYRLLFFCCCRFGTLFCFCFVVWGGKVGLLGFF